LFRKGNQDTEMKTGDTVKLIGMPPNVRDDEVLQTRSLFEKCLGHSFVIAAVESFEGVPFPLARIDVGHVIGKEPWEHTNWVEPEHLELEDLA
jgi:hypothetical protein